MASKPPIDPVCLFHGKKHSEHEGGRCLYCCLCFKPLEPSECSYLPNGEQVDVCVPCAEEEQAMLVAIARGEIVKDPKTRRWVKVKT